MDKQKEHLVTQQIHGTNKQIENKIPSADAIVVFSLINIKVIATRPPTRDGIVTFLSAGNNLESFHSIHGARLIKKTAGTNIGVITELK